MFSNDSLSRPQVFMDFRVLKSSWSKRQISLCLQPNNKFERKVTIKNSTFSSSLGVFPFHQKKIVESAALKNLWAKILADTTILHHSHFNGVYSPHQSEWEWTPSLKVCLYLHQKRRKNWTTKGIKRYDCQLNPKGLNLNGMSDWETWTT